MDMSRFLYEVGFFCARFVTLPRCPDVNANHPIERNYGHSVRSRKTGPRPNRRATVYFGMQLISARSILLNKISMWALSTVPLFAGKSRFFFYPKCPSKNIIQVGRSAMNRPYRPTHSFSRKLRGSRIPM